MIQFVVPLLLIGAVILAHELGHCLAARCAGIAVRTFSVGFGPKVFGWTGGGTEYRLSLIPLGGYVVPAVAGEREFFAIPVFRRMVMTAGGPLASLLLPVACFALANALVSGASLYAVFVKPFLQAGLLLEAIVHALPKLFTGKTGLTGIVGIVAQGGHVIGGSLPKALRFAGVLSLNFAVLNILPIPALDGGKLLLYILEKIHVKFLRLHVPFAVAGWILVLALTLYVTVTDILKIC